jgi:hypothetical protein
VAGKNLISKKIQPLQVLSNRPGRKCLSCDRNFKKEKKMLKKWISAILISTMLYGSAIAVLVIVVIATIIAICSINIKINLNP